MTTPPRIPCPAVNYAISVTCKDLDRDRVALTQLDRSLQWVHVTLAAVENENQHPEVKHKTQKAEQALTNTAEPLKELYDATRQLYAALNGLQTTLKQAHTQTIENRK